MLKPVGNRGLRSIRHDARSVAKITLHIPADDELHVSDDVAEQLLAASPQFTEGPKAAKKSAAKKPAAKAAKKTAAKKP